LDFITIFAILILEVTRNMNRSLLISIVALALGGCAAMSGSPGENTSKASATYDTMHSTPPSPVKEDVPRLADKEVWMPGYYQPVAGAWVWHQGQVMPEKEGYKLVPASYREQDGNVTFVPPRWRRADLADSTAK
jgi:hypothetical protein